MKLDLKLATPITLFPASHGLLTSADLELLLTNQKQQIRNLDHAVSALLLVDHRLKHIEFYRDSATILDSNLTKIFDYLEDDIKTKSRKNEDTSEQQALLKQHEQIAARLDKAKRNISDDLFAKRFTTTREQIDPTRVVNAFVTWPASAGILGKFVFGDQSKLPYFAAGAAGALGLIAAFPFQLVRGFKFTKREIQNTGLEIKNSFMLYYVKETVRRNVLGISVAAVLVTKRKAKLPICAHERVQKYNTDLKY